VHEFGFIYKVVMLSALCIGRLYPTGSSPGIHFCYRLSRPQGHSAGGRNMPVRILNDTSGNRTRDLPSCSAVPQPVASPRVSVPIPIIPKFKHGTVCPHCRLPIAYRRPLPHTVHRQFMVFASDPTLHKAVGA
jgi:hypothetical protein